MTWILGFTYFANGSEWMAILFTLLNSLQGVFILLFHVVLNDKAKQELLRHLKSTKSEVKVMTLLNNCRSCRTEKIWATYSGRFSTAATQGPLVVLVKTLKIDNFVQFKKNRVSYSGSL